MRLPHRVTRQAPMFSNVDRGFMVSATGPFERCQMKAKTTLAGMRASFGCAHAAVMIADAAPLRLQGAN